MLFIHLVLGMAFSPLTPMGSAKPSPIVVEIDGLIYVLAGTHGVPDPFFEVYDPCTNTWCGLDFPPSLVPTGYGIRDMDIAPFECHFVINKKSCFIYLRLICL